MTTTPLSDRVPVWVSLTALAVGGFAIGTTEFASMGLLPAIAGDTGVSIPTAGHAISAYALGVVVGAPVLAVVGARMRRKPLLLLLAAALGVANLASGLAPSFGSLVVARFASGLPHGAYFGIAAVVAASLVPAERRSRAVAGTMLGLMVANVVGVPVTTWLGQSFGWRSTYVAVVAVALVTVLAVAAFVPDRPTHEGASPRQELSALARPQVWLALLTGAVGFGGMFAVYSYVSPLLTEVAGLGVAGVPVVLALIGLGMTLGTILAGRLSDWSPVGTIAIGSTLMIADLLTLQVTAHGRVTAAVTLFAMGFVSVQAVPALTARLLDVAGEGQALASSLNHSAFNVANALGAWLGGLVVAAGLGWTSPALVGVVLAVLGLGVLGASVLLERRTAAAQPGGSVTSGAVTSGPVASETVAEPAPA